MGPFWEHRMRSPELSPVLKLVAAFAVKIIISDVSDRRGMPKKGLQPAETALSFNIPASITPSAPAYIDLAQCLSAVNRRLYSQGKDYYISRIVYSNAGGGSFGLVTLPDTWVTANAWVKAKALWHTMNKGVLKDNPSVQGKWADFKVFMDKDHYEDGTVSSTGTTINLLPVDASNTGVRTGEWYYGRYVEPQHDVVQATGVEKPADEYYCHMMGDDSGSAGAYNSVAIIKGYATTRARVQVAPDVPTGMQDNWMTALSDLGGQDPELANVLEDANDNPPYDIDDYVGGDSNFAGGSFQSLMTATVTNPVDKEVGFRVPLGLLKIINNSSSTGFVTLYLTPGHYKGVLASEVKQ